MALMKTLYMKLRYHKDMKIVILRHGETEWNSRNLVLGRTDIPLNEKGRQQADEVGKRLQSMNFDKIFSSPLSRAVETADIVSKHQKNNCSRVISKCLTEQCFGIFEGVNRSLLDYQSEKRQYFKRYEKGESYLDVAARVYPFIENILNTETGNILLVTHNGICRIIVNYFMGMGNEEFVTFRLGNCEFKTFEF